MTTATAKTAAPLKAPKLTANAIRVSLIIPGANAAIAADIIRPEHAKPMWAAATGITITAWAAAKGSAMGFIADRFDHFAAWFGYKINRIEGHNGMITLTIMGVKPGTAYAWATIAKRALEGRTLARHEVKPYKLQASIVSRRFATQFAPSCSPLGTAYVRSGFDRTIRDSCPILRAMDALVKEYK